MQKNSKIFIAFLVFVAVILAFEFYKGKEQMATRQEDYSMYVEAEKNIIEGKDPEVGLLQLDVLEEDYIVTPEMVTNRTIAYLILGQYDKVEKTLEKAFEENRRLESNFNLLLTYAQAANENNNEEKVEQMIQKINKLELTEDQQKKVKQFTDEMQSEKEE